MRRYRLLLLLLGVTSRDQAYQAGTCALPSRRPAPAAADCRASNGHDAMHYHNAQSTRAPFADVVCSAAVNHRAGVSLASALRSLPGNQLLLCQRRRRIANVSRFIKKSARLTNDRSLANFELYVRNDNAAGKQTGVASAASTLQRRLFSRSVTWQLSPFKFVAL